MDKIKYGSFLLQKTLSLACLINTRMAGLFIILCCCTFLTELKGQCTIFFIDCPSTVTLTDCDNSGDEQIQWPKIIANPTGLCSNYTINQIAGPVQGSVVPLGNYLIVYLASATDIYTQAQSQTICQFFVNVISDTQPPVFTSCPSNVVIYGIDDGSGNCNIQEYWPIPTSTDNCSNASPPSGTFECGSSFPQGNTTVTYTTTDPSGNTATCSFTVTVICTTPTESVSKSYKEVFINPNPAKELLTIDLVEPSISGESLKIVDFTGKILSERSLQAGNTIQTMDTGSLLPGIYLLQITLNGRVQFVDKFVKL